ncbi:MAG: hypothetical protein IJP07_06830, partial [Firmicutes bacterium]|nr:hypothetical protein [Bacillota bacterium]
LPRDDNRKRLSSYPKQPKGKSFLTHFFSKKWGLSRFPASAGNVRSPRCFAGRYCVSPQQKLPRDDNRKQLPSYPKKPKGKSFLTHFFQKSGGFPAFHGFRASETLQQLSTFTCQRSTVNSSRLLRETFHTSVFCKRTGAGQRLSLFSLPQSKTNRQTPGLPPLPGMDKPRL